MRPSNLWFHRFCCFNQGRLQRSFWLKRIIEAMVLRLWQNLKRGWLLKKKKVMTPLAEMASRKSIPRLRALTPHHMHSGHTHDVSSFASFPSRGTSHRLKQNHFYVSSTFQLSLKEHPSVRDGNTRRLRTSLEPRFSECWVCILGVEVVSKER